MAPAVLRVARALHEAPLLQRIEEADELAAIDAEGIGDRRLGLALALVEERQDAVVVRAEPQIVEFLHRAALARAAHPAQEESGAGEQLLGQPKPW